MQLVGTGSSPFTRKVRVLALEKRVPLRFVIDSPLSDSSTVTELNPLGKVPVLITDTGVPLIDSSLIVDYIESLGATPVLIPSDPVLRSAVKQWEAIADGVLDAAVLVRMEMLRPPHQQSADWIARQRGKIDRGLDYLDRVVLGREFCVGDSLTLADIALGCCMSYLHFRFAADGWRERFSALGAMAGRLEQRASFRATPMEG